jgi:hypothetical protein
MEALARVTAQMRPGASGAPSSDDLDVWERASDRVPSERRWTTSSDGNFPSGLGSIASWIVIHFSGRRSPPRSLNLPLELITGRLCRGYA